MPLPASVTKSVAKDYAGLAAIRSFDWDKINPQRGELIDRFNREIKLQRWELRDASSLNSRHGRA